MIDYNKKRKEMYNALRKAGYSSKEARDYRNLIDDMNNIPKPESGILQRNFANARASRNTKVSSKNKYNTNKKIRYNMFRAAGYSVEEARRMSTYKVDISGIRLNERGKVIRDDNFLKKAKELSPDEYVSYARNIVENTTVLHLWRILLTDEEHKEYTTRTVNYIKRANNLNNDQAYYFLYYMTMHGISYQDARIELLSNREFEIYVSNSKSYPGPRKPF
jgi:hypothetical protein